MTVDEFIVAKQMIDWDAATLIEFNVNNTIFDIDSDISNIFTKKISLPIDYSKIFTIKTSKYLSKLKNVNPHYNLGLFPANNTFLQKGESFLYSGLIVSLSQYLSSYFDCNK